MFYPRVLTVSSLRIVPKFHLCFISSSLPLPRFDLDRIDCAGKMRSWVFFLLFFFAPFLHTLRSLIFRSLITQPLHYDTNATCFEWSFLSVGRAQKRMHGEYVFDSKIFVKYFKEKEAAAVNGSKNRGEYDDILPTETVGTLWEKPTTFGFVYSLRLLRFAPFLLPPRPSSSRSLA